MRVLFVGHGSPLTRSRRTRLRALSGRFEKKLPKPKAVCVVSAHWVTSGCHVLDVAWPKTIYDFYGFPRPLHEVQYPAPGAVTVAKRLAMEHHLLIAIAEHDVEVTVRWGRSLLAEAHPTREHYAPILYCLGSTDERDRVSYPYEGMEFGAISMRMALFEPEDS